jgi:predicted metalloprotease
MLAPTFVRPQAVTEVQARMELGNSRRSTNVEDRRGVVVRRGAIGGGAVLIAVVAALLGAPPDLVRQLLSGGGTTTSEPGARPVDPAQAPAVDFVKLVLGDTEDTWNALFRAAGRKYEEPRLVLFSEAVESACGLAGAAVGPFYCPPDHKVYLDLTFFEELDRRFGAPGDFAQAYVIAHEVGHHVQNLLGITERVQRARNEAQGASGASVRVELQADCLAGVWAHHADRARHVLDAGDVDEGLRAASAIGDDTLQRRAQGRVAPETFTHGTSAQRVRWFKRGLDRGSLDDCDTFAAESL